MNKIFELIKKEKFYCFIVGFILFIGCIIRIKAFLVCRPLWHDECSLAINILHRNILQFFTPLEHFQCAPPLFMVITKVVTQIANINEYSLRFIPFLAGIFSLPLFYLLSTKLFTQKHAQILATTLFTINFNLIYYSQEFKQYSLDVFFIILLTLLLAKTDLIEYTNKKLVFIGTLLSSLPLISFPCVYAIIAYFLMQIIEHKKAILKQLCLISIFPIISGMFVFIPNIINNQNQIFLKNYFETAGFLTLNPISILASLKLNYNYFFYPNNFILLGIILTIIAIIHISKNKLNKYQLFLLLILVGSIVGAIFHIYPIYERVSLYLIPSILFILLKPIDDINKKSLTKSIVITLLTLLYFGNYIPNLINNFDKIAGIDREDARNSLKYIEENYSDNDIVVFNNASDSEFEFYSDKLQFYPATIKTNLQTTQQIEYNQLLNQLPKGTTYWFYYPYSLSKYPESSMLEHWAENKNVILAKKFKNSLAMKIKL